MSTMTLSPAYDVRARMQPRPGQLRLTRRGRFVVFLAAALLVLGAALFLGAASVATDQPGTEQPTRVVMVGQGETLWGISAELAQDGEVREMMHTIKELNALDSSMLMTGQEIFVPVTD